MQHKTSALVGSLWYAILLAAVSVGAADEPAAFPLGVAAGDVTASSAVLWTKAAGGAEVTLELASTADFAPPLTFVAWATSRSAHDDTIKIDVTGLAPATTYFYRFISTPEFAISRTGRFTTLAAATDAAPLSFVFSGDTNYSFAPFTVVEDMAAENAELFIWFGDTIYGDVPSGGLGAAVTLDDYWAKYRQIRSETGIRDVLAKMALLTGGDDHEVRNDYAGTDPRLDPLQRSAGLQAFFDYMPIRENPAEPFRMYRRFRAGANVEFFMLDGRQYRDPSVKAECNSNPDPYGFLLGPLSRRDDCVDLLTDPARTMLGAAQYEWLTTGLLESTAAVKFIVNNVPLSYVGPYPYDRWDGYDGERRRLLEFIDQNAIDGVVFLTTDIHANAYNPDVLAYFRARRSDYALPGNVAVPEIIVGPLGNATFHQSVTGAGDVLGRFGIALAGAAERVLSSKVRRVNGLEMLDTNQVSYVRVDVSSDGLVDVSYRGRRPGSQTGSAAFFDGDVSTTPTDSGPAFLTPCALPLLGLAAVGALLARSRPMA